MEQFGGGLLPVQITEQTAQRQYMRHRVVRKVQSNTHFLAMASMFCGLLGFPSYWMAVDNSIWFGQLFTYLTFVLVSYALLLENGRRNLAILTLLLVTAWLALVQLTPFAQLFNQISFFLRHISPSGMLSDTSNSEYVASSVLSCLVALSYLSHRGEWIKTSQTLLCAAIMIPFIPLLGLMFGIYQPYGSMSLLATYSGLLCASGLLAHQASHPPLSYLLLMDETGKRIRISVVLLSMGAIILAASSLRLDASHRALPLLMAIAIVIVVYTMAVTYYQSGNQPQEKVLPPADMDFASQVENALDNREFYLAYQPQLEFEGGRLKGVEAVIRWLRPGKGIVSPVQFIRVAELTGLIVPLGKWALREACQQMHDLRSERGFESIELSVNVSPLQLKSEHFVEDVLQILAETGFPAQRLVLELTESTFVADDGANLRIMNALKQAGIKLAIDDFGTGYSCLAYLRDIPADYLKIDRSFVLDLPGHNKAEAVIQGIVSLAKSLNYRLIAEGVETKAQSDYLQALGCDIVQGFLHAKPMEASALMSWVSDHYGR